jgi:hypothetical protein
MPEIAFSSRDELEEVAEGDDLLGEALFEARLNSIWDNIGRDLGLEEHTEPVVPSEVHQELLSDDIDFDNDIECHPTEINDSIPAVAVELPERKETGLAQLILLVLEENETRVFTLEHHAGVEEGGTTMLCERKQTEDGMTSHINYGPGPDVEIAAFAEAVSDLV